MKRIRVEYLYEAMNIAKEAIDAIIYQDSYIGYIVEFVPA